MSNCNDKLCTSEVDVVSTPSRKRSESGRKKNLMKAIKKMLQS